MTPTRQFNSKLIWGPIVILGLIGLLLYLQGAFADKVAPGTTDITISPAQGRTATVVRETLPLILKWPATVAPHTVARIAPKIPGRILKITVDIGDSVKSGHLLAQLDDRQIRAQLAAARAQLTAAQAQARRAAADARRLRNLFRQEAATEQSLDAALAAERGSRAQVEAARQQIEAIRAQSNETRLLAPFAGNVIERRANPGDMGLPGNPILLLQDPSRMRVEAAIPEQCARRLAIGDPLTVIEPGSDSKVAARVTDKAAAADPRSHTVLVKAALPPDHSFTPGAFAWAEQRCGEQETLLLPVSAIQRVGQLEQVVQVIDGKRHIRLVRTGRRMDDTVEILSGVQPGDVVLLPEAAE